MMATRLSKFGRWPDVSTLTLRAMNLMRATLTGGVMPPKPTLIMASDPKVFVGEGGDYKALVLA